MTLPSISQVTRNLREYFNCWFRTVDEYSCGQSL